MWIGAAAEDEAAVVIAEVDPGMLDTVGDAELVVGGADEVTSPEVVASVGSAVDGVGVTTTATEPVAELVDPEIVDPSVRDAVQPAAASTTIDRQIPALRIPTAYEVASTGGVEPCRTRPLETIRSTDGGTLRPISASGPADRSSAGPMDLPEQDFGPRCGALAPGQDCPRHRDHTRIVRTGEGHHA